MRIRPGSLSPTSVDTMLLVNALYAEGLKLRRTRALWLAFGAPLAVVLLFVLLTIAGAFPGDATWPRTVQGMLGLWVTLMLPLYIALETALINAVDHEARGWKHVFAQPVPRWCVHAAKLIVAVAMVGISSAVLVGGLLVAVFALEHAPIATPSGVVPGRAVAVGVLRSYGASLAIIAVHHALSMRLRGFEWPLGIGIVATLFGTQISRSPDYWPLFPWSYPATTVLSSTHAFRLWAIALSVGVAVVVALVAGYSISRRDVL
jgi:hypothetical protein